MEATVTQTDLRQQPSATRERRGFVAGATEARPGIVTTEMWMTWISAIVFVIAAYVSDSFDNDLGWILAAAVFVAYILSRGLAKSGSREGPFIVGTPPEQRS
jgi:hypothetical protein